MPYGQPRLSGKGGRPDRASRPGTRGAAARTGRLPGLDVAGSYRIPAAGRCTGRRTAARPYMDEAAGVHEPAGLARGGEAGFTRACGRADYTSRAGPRKGRGRPALENGLYARDFFPRFRLVENPQPLRKISGNGFFNNGFSGNRIPFL